MMEEVELKKVVLNFGKIVVMTWQAVLNSYTFLGMIFLELSF